MDLSPMLACAERLMALPYEQATLETEVLLKQVDGQLHSPAATASDKKNLKSLRDRLITRLSTADGDNKVGPDL